MMNIKKRSEKQEEFASRKIEKSIMKAGADEKRHEASPKASSPEKV